jgi:phage/plasmid primase-like uncharacterized protein
MTDRAAFKDAVREALIDRAEALFTLAWGDPVRQSGREWRARADDAQSMQMQGADRGKWFDHKAGVGGDVFHFYGVNILGLEKGQDFARVLNEAANWCGILRNQPVDLTALHRTQKARAEKAAEEEKRDSRQRAQLVADLMAQAKPIKGTPAAAYLAARGITELPADGLAYLDPVGSGASIMHPRFAACVIWAKDEQGKIVGGQRIVLNKDGTRADVDGPKPFFAAAAGCPARFAARIPDSPLCIAEGPESALSVWLATGFETWAVFGVSNWQSAPIPTGRKVILCPDRDLPEGTHAPESEKAKAKEAAARAFNKAVAHHASRNCDLWIATAPEPVGSKRDLNDTLQRAGVQAVRAAVEAAERGPEPPERDRKGRFTGPSLQPFTGTAPDAGKPTDLSTARMKTAADIQSALDACAEWDGEGLAPVVAIKSDPGLGKSRITRELLQQAENSGRIFGDVHFYAPSLKLADEGAEHAESIGLTHAVTRGRLAKNPATGETMCARPEEAERVAKLGQPVKATLCIAEDDQGMERKCPFYDMCEHRRQFIDLPEGNAVRFEALPYLNLPDAAEGRAIGIRIIDESFWRAMGREATITLDALLSPRSEGKCKSDTKRAERTGVIADLMACAGNIAATLRRGAPIMDALDGYTAEDIRTFAKAERWGEYRLPFFPDADANTIDSALKPAEAHNRQAGAKAQFWANLEAALETGVVDLQNIVFLPGYRPQKTSDPRDVVKVYWSAQPPRDVPVILLDADADSTLIDPFYPSHEMHRAQVTPNADVVYITDRTFSKKSLLGKPARDEWRNALAVEVMNDHGGGVLAIATRKVVAAFFTDAGHDLSTMTDEQASAFMLATPLHGARWAWFGPATLGSNIWKDCTTCVVMGREEWPVDALESEARKIWGHGLQLIEADERGNRIMPSVPMPFPMADGTTYSVDVWAHPDPRVRAIQWQARECATRQGVERLRLASATVRKRVVIGSRVPIPGLPATHAVTWQEYAPSREEAAFAEAGGALRISGKGLATDAPITFQSQKAAQRYAERTDLAESLFDPHTLNNTYINGVGVKCRVLVAFRIKGVRGSAKTRAVLACDARDAERIAQEKWGELTGFEVLREVGQKPERVEKPEQPVIVGIDYEHSVPRSLMSQRDQLPITVVPSAINSSVRPDLSAIAGRKGAGP